MVSWRVKVELGPERMGSSEGGLERTHCWAFWPDMLKDVEVGGGGEGAVGQLRWVVEGMK